MTYKLRDYQQEASDAAVKFFTDGQKYNGLIVAPTGCGKSLLVADIANRLGGNVLVFQPSKEYCNRTTASTHPMECLIAASIRHPSTRRKYRVSRLRRLEASRAIPNCSSGSSTSSLMSATVATRRKECIRTSFTNWAIRRFLD